VAGYQADADLQASALYDVLRHDIALAYVYSITSFNLDATAVDQRVRLPAETLRTRSANCSSTSAALVASRSKHARFTQRCSSAKTMRLSGGAPSRQWRVGAREMTVFS
jgi:hypothetical protein